MRGFLLFDLPWQGHVERYAVYVPKSWDGRSPLPAILYLHGRGESGTDGVRQLLIGLPRAVMDRADRWPFLIIAPQKSEMDAEWFDQRDWLDAMLGLVERVWPIDPARRYITGLSQGGRGTMRLAGGVAWKFAAAAPVCGWCNPDEAATSLNGIPTWAFHGDADTVVPVEGTRRVIERLRERGASPRETIYPGVEHNSWDLAYASELPEWFLQHRR